MSPKISLFLSLDLWCKDLVPKKENKTVSDNGLSLCADQMFDFVQKMGDLRLALSRAGTITRNISLSQSWSVMQRFVPQKENKAVWDNGPSLYADQMHVWLCTRDGRLKAGPLKGKYFHQKHLFFSLNLWCKDFVPPPPPKKKKKKKKKKKLWTVLYADRVFDFVQEMRDLRLAL